MLVTRRPRVVAAVVLMTVLVALVATLRSQTGPPPGRKAVADHGTPRLEVGDPDRGGTRNPAVEAYADRAYPRGYITAQQVKRAQTAVRGLPERSRAAAFAPGTPDVSARLAVGTDWQFIGPDVPFAPGPVTVSLRDSITSGRVTALAVSPTCDLAGSGRGSCRAWVATAGGGVWRTDDALSQAPHWVSVQNGLPTNALGALTVDPADASGNTIYAGTGEANATNQAGLGLYRSTDGGDTWALVPGSYAIAQNRTIGAVRFGRNHAIWLGTAVGVHGQSSASGGIAVPPGTAELAVWKSTDNGLTFRLQKSLLPNGSANRGGVNDIEVDPADPSRVYVGFFGYGVWRTTDDGTTWEQVFSPTSASATERTEFALTRAAGNTRIYLADGVSGNGNLYRTDDASASAATLNPPGTPNAGWTKLSSPVNGTPGFASFNLCQRQCSYDLFVETPPGRPDTVWFGGSMVYAEIRPLQDLSLAGTSNRSNGRAVMRSTDAGEHFTDMTADARRHDGSEPFYEQMHPDQHALAFDPRRPDVAIVGSDGGVVRTDGTYVDISDECATRDGVAASPDDTADCLQWLSSVPHRIVNMNAGLGTLQFNSLSVDPKDANGDLMGGTQDNGTFAFDGTPRSWFESVNGDGGPSAFDVGDSNIRLHTYFTGFGDINHHGTDPNTWAFVTQPITDSGEQTSFYTPVLADPVKPGTMFVGAQHVWRTLDDGGDRVKLEAHCAAPGGVPKYDLTMVCGDFEPLGADLTTAFGSTRAGNYVVAVERAPADTHTLWAATRLGRLFVSKNADAADPATVAWSRIDTRDTPSRFPSGVAIDPADANHAFVSYSGYFDGNPTGLDNPGHVFDVQFDPARKTAEFTDISGNLPDAPITDVAYDDRTGDLYAATDFGVLRLPAGASEWTQASDNFPPALTPGLTIRPDARVMYAATYGRSIWKLQLPAVPASGNPDGGGTTIPAGGGTQPTTGGPPSAPAPGGTVGAAAVGAPVVVGRAVRVSRTRTARMVLRCGATTAGRCKGTLSVARGGRSLARRSFSVRADRRATVAVRLTRKAFRSLARHHRLASTAAVATRGADGRLRRGTANITLLAPKRR